VTDQTETARALLWRHGLPEDIIDGALCLHAQELAAVQRKEADDLHQTEPGVVKGLRIGADLIDPACETVSAGVAPATDQTALRERIAQALMGPDAAGTLDSAADEMIDAVLAVLPAPASCPNPIECGHEAALGQAQQEVRRLGLMVDEYGAGASALTDKLRRVRELHQETCPFAKGEIPSGPLCCGMCEVLDAPATAVLPASIDRAAVLPEPTDDDVERLGQWLWDNCSEDERTGLLSDDPRRIAAMALRWPELRRVAAVSAPADTGHDDSETPTPCGPAPSQCDAEAGEPCADHEREQAHAEGEHAFCGAECEQACTCAAAGDAFAPLGHYRDCPQAAEQPAAAQQPKEARP